LWGALMGFGTLWYFAFQRKKFTGPAIFGEAHKA
jgi:hypothetical protein